MDAELNRQWYATVGPDEVVLHLGDLALGPISEALPPTVQFHGRRFPVSDNHDLISRATQINRATEGLTALYREAGWSILPRSRVWHPHGETHAGVALPFAKDMYYEDHQPAHQPTDRGFGLLHGHTHD